MRLYFDCETNDHPMINYAIFKDKNGYEYSIDRHCTRYDIFLEDKELSMEWEGVHVWDGERENEITDEWFRDKTFVCFELEDDAEEKYYCNAYAVVILDPWYTEIPIEKGE